MQINKLTMKKITDQWIIPENWKKIKKRKMKMIKYYSEDFNKIIWNRGKICSIIMKI